MSPEWGSLPLLPLRCVLDHLSTEDALAAMSTCRHWRDAVLLYEGHKDTLNLRAKNLEASLFVTRIFRRHTRKLHVHLDCGEHELEKFVNFVLTQFFDTAKLQELIFIGTSYEQQSRNVPFVKLKRLITETLVFKHAHSLQKLGFMGCEMAAVNDENDRYTHKHVEYYSRPLSFGGETAADTILSGANSSLMVYSAIQHIIVDYRQMNTEALETLGKLGKLECLSLNLADGRPEPLAPLDWRRARRAFIRPLHVAVNIIAVPTRRFNDIIENVLVDGLALTSLKVLFCKTMYAPLLSHVSEMYHASLRELVWADQPAPPAQPRSRRDSGYRLLSSTNYSDANPFVILSWQCTNLRRLVIHGYWVFHYDLVGVARLSKTLEQLEVSAVAGPRAGADFAARVQASRAPRPVAAAYIQEVNEHTQFKWQPAGRAHPALRPRCAPRDRADYVLREVARPLYPARE